MILDEVTPITQSEAEAGLASGVPDTICDALVRITYHDPDWRWVQEKCLELAGHADPQVAGLAVTCLGHLARIHRVLDLEKVLPTLRRLQHMLLRGEQGWDYSPPMGGGLRIVTRGAPG